MLYDFCIYDTLKHIEYRKHLYKKHYVLGRSIENDFVLLDPNIPLQWKKVIKKKYGYFIQDLNSEKYEKRYSVSVQFSRIFHCLCIGLFLSFLYFGVVGYHFLKSSYLNTSEKIYLPAKKAYGVFKQDTHDPDLGQKFYFKVKKDIKKPQVLHFSVGNILKTDHLKILINQKELAYAMASEKSWSEEQRLVIPQEYIHFGENELSFQLNRKVQHENRWGVRNIYIIHDQSKKNNPIDLENFKKYLEAFLNIPKHDEHDFLRIEKMSKEYKKIKYQGDLNAVISHKIDHMLSKIEYRKKAFMKQFILANDRQQQFNIHSNEESETD